MTCLYMSRPDQHVPNSGVTKWKIQALGLSVWVCEHTDDMAAGKIRCTLNETIKDTQHILELGELGVLVLEYGVMRPWQLSELMCEGWQPLGLIKNWCQKEIQQCHFQPSLLVTYKLFCFLSYLMKLVQVYYPPEVELLQTLFYWCVLLVQCCNDYSFLSITSVKSWLHQAGLTQQWFTLDEETAGATHSLSTALFLWTCDSSFSSTFYLDIYELNNEHDGFLLRWVFNRITADDLTEVWMFWVISNSNLMNILLK